MGIEVALAVASFAFQVKGALDEKKRAKRQAAIEDETRAIQDKRRALQLQIDKDKLARDQRRRQASIVNNVAVRGGLFTSTFTGQLESISTTGSRELNILTANDALSASISDLRGDQTALNLNTANQNANTAIGEAAIGLGTSFSDIFGGAPSSIFDGGNVSSSPGTEDILNIPT